MKQFSIKMLTACIAVFAAVTPASALTNLLANPGFESGYTGWFTFGPNVLVSTAANDNIMHSGTAASKIYGGFPMCPVPSFNVSGCGQAFTSPTVGRLYEFKGFSFVSSQDVIPGNEVCAYNRMIAKIVFFNAASGGAEIGSNEIVIGDFDTPHDQWIPFSVTAIVPTGALRVEALLLYLQPACDGGAVFTDDLSFGVLPPLPSVTNQLVNPSFNGNLTGWTVFGNTYYDARYWARRTPAGSAKLYSTFNPGFSSGMYQEFAAAPGSTHRFDLHVMTTCMETPIQGANANIVMARIVYLDAALNEIGYAEEAVVDNTAPLGTWVEHSVFAGPAPAGTAHVRPYVLFISPNNEGGSAWVDDTYFGAVVGTGVGQTPSPATLSVYPNVPNPFGNSTRLDFDLAGPENVDVSIYDVAGRRVATLSDGPRAAGSHSVSWDGRASDGLMAPSGVYWCVVKTSRELKSQRMLLLR